MVRATSRQTRGGWTLSVRVWALIEDARRAAGVNHGRARVVQGSWHEGDLSAGTHSGGGAFDLSATALNKAESLVLVDELRRRNVCAWLRSPDFGWTSSGPHIHGIVRDEPGLSQDARAQVKAYDRGLNGLAGRRRDPHARPAQAAPYWLFGEPAPYPLHRLSLGTSGQAVRCLQMALEVPVDGDFGPVTKQAVKKFQRTRPRLWPADGVAGPLTYAAAIQWGWR